MLTICRSTKGGSGTSTVTAGLAGICGRQTIHRTSPPVRVLTIDLLGDLPAVFGTTSPPIGVAEWLDRSSDREFHELTIDCGHSVHLLPTGSNPLPEVTSPSWNRLAAAIDHDIANGTHVFVDAGTGPLPEAFRVRTQTTPLRTLLIVRPCYLALRRAMEDGPHADGVVLVTGGSRVLTRRDVESVLGIPVVAEVPLHPDVARRVDSGLFLSRLPAALVAALEPLVTPFTS